MQDEDDEFIEEAKNMSNPEPLIFSDPPIPLADALIILKELIEDRHTYGMLTREEHEKIFSDYVTEIAKLVNFPGKISNLDGHPVFDSTPYGGNVEKLNDDYSKFKVISLQAEIKLYNLLHSLYEKKIETKYGMAGVQMFKRVSTAIDEVSIKIYQEQSKQPSKFEHKSQSQAGDSKSTSEARAATASSGQPKVHQEEAQQKDRQPMKNVPPMRNAQPMGDSQSKNISQEEQFANRVAEIFAAEYKMSVDAMLPKVLDVLRSAKPLPFPQRGSGLKS